MSFKRKNYRRRAALHLAALVACGLLLAMPSLAEEASPPSKPVAANVEKPKVWPAPIGHRQPRRAEVDGVAPRTGSDEWLDQINRSLDRQLHICRDC